MNTSDSAGVVCPSDQFPPSQALENIPSPQEIKASPWHLRYEQAARRYAEIEFSPELIDALADGFLEWACMLPQTEIDRYGRHKRVNSWGLGPELQQLRAIEAALDLNNEARLCGHVSAMAKDLYTTARFLDECYPRLTEDEAAAERRLVLTCRLTAQTLADLLRQLKKPLFRMPEQTLERTDLQPSSPKSCKSQLKTKPPIGAIRKRAARAANIEAMKRELIAHIKAARDHAYAAIDLNREPNLLPRPLKTELGKLVGITAPAVSRCFKDPTAHELRLLWEVAGDLEAILKYGR